MSMKYTLYKSDTHDIWCIVSYLHFIGRGDSVIPTFIINNTYPKWAINLPSIETNDGERFIGLDETIKFYEHYFQVKDVYNKARYFKTRYPSYFVR